MSLLNYVFLEYAKEESNTTTEKVICSGSKLPLVVVSEPL
jgi:hypothetical protein